MNISSIGIKLPSTSTIKSTNKAIFTGAQRPDSFVCSKPNLKEAVETIRNIKDKNGHSRFDRDEVSQFKKYYDQNKIDIDTVNVFADTKLSMSDMQNIYQIYQKGIFEGKDFKKKDYEIIHNQILELENNSDKITVEEGIYNNNEYSIKDLTADKTYTYEYGGNLIEKEEIQNNTVITEDYKNNTVVKKYLTKNNDRNIIKKVVIDYKNEKGDITHSRITEASKDVEGSINSRIVYANGKTKDLVTSTKDSKTGIVTIKKDLTSPDGVRTQYLYEDDPQGNRLIDYKITDENGKVLYQNSQTFEKISDNKFISSNDSRKYEIIANEKELQVTELGLLNKKISINFKEKVDNFNKTEMISVLKKIPGNMLFEAAEDVKKFEGLKKEEALLAYSSPSEKLISSADNLFIFLHELGHIKDAETLKTKHSMKRHNEEFQYTGDKNIQKTYLKEMKRFIEKNPNSQRQEIRYFLENKKHYAGKWGALSELVAESNAIGSSRTTKATEELLLRSEYLQENFPKTIAEIKNSMRWKEDLDAIEFYGT